jgi:hypothetical protein
MSQYPTAIGGCGGRSSGGELEIAMEGTALQDKDYAGCTVLEENPQPARIHFHGVQSRRVSKQASILFSAPF